MLAAAAIWRVSAEDSTWLTDLPKAQAQAKAENKIVLMDFTGSDWCKWCVKFKEEVLDSREFKDYAAKNVVLVEVDFPRKKMLPSGQVMANSDLKDKYKIEGFPTLVVLNKDGKEIGRQEGYEEGGPKDFIAKLEKFKKS
jgi:protein disulfide-isomerase